MQAVKWFLWTSKLQIFQCSLIKANLSIMETVGKLKMYTYGIFETEV